MKDKADLHIENVKFRELFRIIQYAIDWRDLSHYEKKNHEKAKRLIKELKL